MQLITRAQWGARPRGAGSITPFTPRGVTIHWEGAGWAWPWAHSTCDDKVRQIQAYHMDVREWSDIAYNFLACPHGYVFEGRGLNRRSSANGTWDANTWWYAVQCMWGSKSGSAPQALLVAGRDAIDYCRSEGGAGTELRGHRDMQSTDCPGDQLYAWAHQGAPRPVIAPPPPPPPEDWFDMATKADLEAVIKTVVPGIVKDEIATYMAGLYDASKNGTAGKNHQAVMAKLSALDGEVAKAVWDEQIPDVLTPESGDTAAARTHLTWMPHRVVQVIQPPVVEPPS